MKSPQGAGSNGGVPRRKKWPGAEPCPPPAPTDPQRRLHLSGPLIRPACLPYRPLCTLLAALPVDPLGYPPRGPSGLGTRYPPANLQECSGGVRGVFPQLKTTNSIMPGFSQRTWPAGSICRHQADTPLENKGKAPVWLHSLLLPEVLNAGHCLEFLATNRNQLIPDTHAAELEAAARL